MTDLPPLVDFFGHLGHYRIQTGLADSPLLQRHWDYQWGLVPNMGIDLLLEPLEPLLGLERAAWLITLLIPPLMAFGFARTARAVQGELPVSWLFTLPLTLAYPFQLGFLNYWLGVAIAFHLFPTWLQAESHRPWRRAAFFVPASLLAWLVHGYGWGILVVLSVGAALGGAWQRGDRGIATGWLWPSLRCWPMLAPLLPMALWGRGVTSESSGWFDFPSKVNGLLLILRDQWPLLDYISLAIIIVPLTAGLLMAFPLKAGRVSFAPALGTPALLLFALILLLPAQLSVSALADARLWPVTLATALLAIRLSPDQHRLRGGMTVAGLVIFLTRITVATAGFMALDRAIATHLQALELITSGSRVAVLVKNPCRDHRLIHRLNHIDAMAIVRRDAFTNGQWSIKGSHRVLPLGGAGTSFDADPSQFISGENCNPPLNPDEQMAALHRRIAQIPPDRFDYLWAINFDPRLIAPQPGLISLYADDLTSLYRLDVTQTNP
ncbi:MAG: hypothetical protein WBJ41_01940 [Chromatiaceae bacterium]